jgi:hypothetical protein
MMIFPVGLKYHNAEDFSNMDKCFHKIKVPFKKEFKKVVHNNHIQKTKDKL